MAAGLHVDRRSEKVDLLREAFEAVRPSADGVNVACVCPQCALRGKKSLKLAVRLDDGRAHCWVCDIHTSTHGSIVRLIARTRRHLYVKAKELWPATRRHSVDVVHVADVTLPDGFTLLAPAIDSDDRHLKAVVRYITRRGLTVDDMWRRRLGMSHVSDFVNRVIIPSFAADGKLNYYTSRSIYEDVYPRYRNAAVSKTSIIFNEVDIDWTSELLVTEGPFDAFTSSANETCMLGSELGEDHRLFEHIVMHRTPVLLGLDSGMRRKTDKIAMLLHSYDVPVRVLDVSGYKDIGEMSRDAYERRRVDARQWTPTSRLRCAIASLGIRHE